MPDLARLGSRIRQLRRRRGLSQAQLAEGDLSPSYISLLEAGRRTPSGEVLRKLAQRLECDPEVLLTFLDEASSGELQLELAYAELMLNNGRHEDALAAFQALVDKVGGRETADISAKATWGVAAALEQLGHLEEAIELYENLRTSATHSAGEVAWLTIVVALCRCYREIGDLTRGVDLAEQALAEIERLQLMPTTVGVELLSSLVGLYCERGDMQRAAYLAGNAIEQASRVENREALGAAYWNASMVAHETGRSSDAMMLVQRALAIYSEGSNDRALGRLRNAYASVLLRTDPPDPERAKTLLVDALRLLSEQGSVIDIAYCQTELARAHLLTGSLEAAEHAQRALELLGDSHRLESARALLTLAAAQIMKGDEAAAKRAYERAALILESSEATRQAAFAWAELAELLEARGEGERAVWAYRQGMRCMGHRASTLTYTAGHDGQAETGYRRPTKRGSAG